MKSIYLRKCTYKRSWDIPLLHIIISWACCIGKYSTTCTECPAERKRMTDLGAKLNVDISRTNTRDKGETRSVWKLLLKIQSAKRRNSIAASPIHHIDKFDNINELFSTWLKIESTSRRRIFGRGYGFGDNSLWSASIEREKSSFWVVFTKKNRRQRGPCAKVLSSR